MNGTGGTNGTGPEPVPTGPISTKDAATYFGITERAVRKRIHAGTLMGEQIAGQWVVYPHAVRQGRPPRNPALDRRAEEQRPWTPEPLAEPSGAEASELRIQGHNPPYFALPDYTAHHVIVAIARFRDLISNTCCHFSRKIFLPGGLCSEF